ncbi:MAG TPA: hypothetical protein VMT37_11530 [Solirubrobacterales bacterium]|nr:hypothetical protein [Solirubrobacterales bacterium]
MRVRSLALALLAGGILLFAAASASAAGIVNGDFETGNLAGWLQHNSSPDGEWLTYQTSESAGFFPPPQGNWAALTEEGDPDTAILYQEVALPPYSTSILSLTVYYKSDAPIVVPNPNTLLTGPGATFDNQQLRVDVTKPTAPIESVAAEDILATPFANANGDPEIMAPKTVTADLSAFAGQTVRLRLANAINDSYFNAGVDDVTLTSALINTFTHGKLTKKNGSAIMTVTVPGPGIVKLVSAGKKGKPKPIKALTKNPAAPGKVKLSLKPTGWGKKMLEEKGKLPFKLQLTYEPTGGTATKQTLSGKLKLTGKH